MYSTRLMLSVQYVVNVDEALACSDEIVGSDQSGCATETPERAEVVVIRVVVAPAGEMAADPKNRTIAVTSMNVDVESLVKGLIINVPILCPVKKKL